MELAYQENTYLTLKNQYGKVLNEMIFIVAKSGYGKGLASEAILEEFHKAGYVVIALADPKDELEMAYAMFEPQENYHVDNLNLVGKHKSKKKVKLYHPFTFKIPKRSLPEFNFYTFSLKELGRKEWSMIAETAWDTDTIKLLLNASQNITNEDGIYGFMHYLQEIVKGKIDKKKIQPDPKNFFLSVTSGTAKSIQDIANYIQPFKNDFFLTKENSPTHLNWKKILRDQEHYHVFTSHWIKDPKLKVFCVMTLFNKIVEHKHFATKPIIIFIPEIRYLTPFKPEGYQKFLAQGIKDNLSMMRSMGRGMSCLFDTQVWSGVDEEVRNSATTTLIGELGGASDKEKLSKANRYGKEQQKLLSKQEAQNTYMIQGKEDLGGIRIWFPSHMHKEPQYNFFEQFRKHNPEGLKSYNDLIDAKKKEIKDEEAKYRDRIKQQSIRKKREEERIKKEKEKLELEKLKIKESRPAVKEDFSTTVLHRKIWKERKEGKSLRELAEEYLGNKNKKDRIIRICEGVEKEMAEAQEQIL